jgi:GNAT superfamily N-acetyltransferase
MSVTAIMTDFKYITINSNDDRIQTFFDQYLNDIEFFFPDFDIEEISLSEIEILIIDDKCCGVIIYHGKGEEMHIELDYVIKEFRNLGIGQSYIPELFTQFKKLGYKEVFAKTGNDRHKIYLDGLGFNSSKSHPDLLEQKL